MMGLDWTTWGITLAAGGLGAATAAGQIVVDWVAWMLVLPGRRRGTVEADRRVFDDPDSPERRLGEPIAAIAPDGVPLAGLWHPAARPMDDEPDPPGDDPPPSRSRGVVVLLHGFAEDPAGLRERMRALNHHGWDVAALDSRAHGRSGGDRSSFGRREAEDLSAWLDDLERSGRLLDRGNSGVAIWGRSMGAAIAIQAAARDRRISAVVLEAPFLDLRATLIRILRRKHVPLSRWFAARVLRRARHLSGLPLHDPRPIDVAPRVEVPTLVIHGTHDTLIPLAEAARLAAALPRSEPLVAVPGAGHNNVVETGGPSLLEQIAGFLDRSRDVR